MVTFSTEIRWEVRYNMKQVQKHWDAIAQRAIFNVLHNFLKESNTSSMSVKTFEEMANNCYAEGNKDHIWYNIVGLQMLGYIKYYDQAKYPFVVITALGHNKWNKYKGGK